MAEEPQPSNVQEGADAPDVLPASKEDRKAAQALSSLDAKVNDDAVAKKEVDLKALGDALKNLDAQNTQKSPAAVKKEEAPKKPLTKVAAEDVALLVEHLDLSKAKATDLLRAHDADAIKAMNAWVTSSA
ncbi:uncharacterized protein MYCFIDRAFT_48247 [Pseudocercospora fijiensis CIRAD86]|uniref:Nascent polypeptide-associated complex subunit alpha-like UBA domain-containing protein n=1 Tax=Pseudocercospora fijiensis (strain CIRAD86) TaxID=383855 RepID=N1QAM3_PSEFD|nr:uncharacterized protein MYCFIDRAFT_48247 [Pseudocercospora fijiensis CIRAD86]EME88032.1 hypothetical protein MYCFIDRAFT_48247 [Pseudocercospora fijiensis CIRAD86]